MTVSTHLRIRDDFARVSSSLAKRVREEEEEWGRMLTDDESKPETDPIIGRLFCAPLFAPLLIHSVVLHVPCGALQSYLTWLCWCLEIAKWTVASPVSWMMQHSVIQPSPGPRSLYKQMYLILDGASECFGTPVHKAPAVREVLTKQWCNTSIIREISDLVMASQNGLVWHADSGFERGIFNKNRIKWDLLNPFTNLILFP